MKNTLLALAFITASTMVHAQCTQIFFSEYVEGSSHSKAVELYNPTNSTVNLTGYRIVRYSNGQTTVDSYMDPTGSVAAHDVYIITNGVATPDGQGAFCDPTLYAMADEHDGAVYPTPMHMNGDDAITLELISNGAILDIMGKVGEDPGTAWMDANNAWWTANHTLIRKSSVTGGVTTNPVTFDPTVQWDSLPEDTWTNLGQHACDCNTNSVNETENNEVFYLFPNPVGEGNVLIKGTSEIETIDVYNAIGEKVYSSLGDAGRADFYLSTAAFTSGIYMIQITFTNQKLATQRLIKK